MEEQKPLEIKEFELLYGIDSSKKIKTWYIKVLQYTNYSDIITIYGYNRKIELKRRIESGKNIGKKNETSHFQQAVADAKSKWTKKQSIENYTTTVPIIDCGTDMLHNVIRFPMLAQDYKKQKNKVSFPCYIQPKLDGYRCIYDTKTQTITSRQGKSFEIIKQSGKLYEELKSLNNDVILDGELYVHNINIDNPILTFEELGILRKTKKLTASDIEKLYKIEYHVYDIIDSKLTFEKRLEILEHLNLNIRFTKIKLVPTMKIYNEENIEENHIKNVNNSYEGSIIRNLNGMYKEKFRSNDLLKLKNFMDAEFEIINFHAEIDNLNEKLVIWDVKVGPTIKHTICSGPIDLLTSERGIKTIDNFVECSVSPQGTNQERKELYKQCVEDFSLFKGKKLWTRFFEYTNSGNLRFPTTKTSSYTSYIRDEII
jgi:hypothetical protein